MNRTLANAVVLLAAFLSATVVRSANAQVAGQTPRPATPPSPLRYIQIAAAADGPDHFSGWRQSAPVPAQVQVNLELGDELGGQVMQVAADSPADDYRVWVQFETSAALGDEGPHIDLLNWKHCRSAWRPAKRLQDNAFELPRATENESTCFPAASKSELRAALRKELANYDAIDVSRWLRVAEQAPRVGEWPAYVAISTVRVRVERKVGTDWHSVTTIEFKVPMGC